MSETLETLKRLPRRVRPVPIADNVSIPVRDLLLAELEWIDKLASKISDPDEANIQRSVLMTGLAIADPDGTSPFPALKAAEKSGKYTEEVVEQNVGLLHETVRFLAPAAIKAISVAAVPDKAQAKN